MKMINGVRDVRPVRAESVEPGMITLDGVVLSKIVESTFREDTVTIEHRHTTYVQAPGDRVEIYGCLDHASFKALVEEIEREKVTR